MVLRGEWQSSAKHGRKYVVNAVYLDKLDCYEK